MMTCRNLLCCAVLLCAGVSLYGEALPQYASEVHLGVATCASGVCHGSVSARTSTDVPQNEYVTWSRLDRHSNAYNLLLSEKSRQIADNLGLANAHEAAVCLDCHADNVPEALRGARFQISDGIGCEACHGGAERYISSHVDPDISSIENHANGLYPTGQFPSRAALCFSCHLGSDNKIASHEIMGAGHPRLSFELDTFSVLQPAHHVVDEDYVQRKGAAGNVSVWALGQVEAAAQTLRLIETKLIPENSLFPELSLFDCHACHHAMSDQKWVSQERNPAPPGTVRLNDSGLLMLIPLARVFDESLQAGLHSGLQSLHHQVNKSENAVAAVSGLRRNLDLLSSAISRKPSGTSEARKLLDEILAMGSQGQFHDYVAAEQAVMAIDMLLSVLGNRDDRSDWVDQLYETVADEDQFYAGDFIDLFLTYPDSP